MILIFKILISIIVLREVDDEKGNLEINEVLDESARIL